MTHPGVRVLRGCRAASLVALLISQAVSVRAQAPSVDPGQAPAERPRIEVGVLVVDLIEIDDRSQVFTADLVVSARWSDPRLANGKPRRLPLSSVWHPGLTVLNERGMRRLFAEEVFVDPSGEVLYRQRLFGPLAARLDLHDFPFDRQQLQVRVLAAIPVPEVELALDSSRIGRIGEFSALGWDIEMTEPFIETTIMEALGREMPQMVVSIEAKRQRSFFRWSVFLPLALLVLMAWTVFWIDENLVPSQIGVTTAAVFSIIAFRLSLRLMLPPVSYMTRVDTYLLGATLLVFAALAVAILVGRLVKQEKTEQIRKVQTWGRWAFLALFLILTMTVLRW